MRRVAGLLLVILLVMGALVAWLATGEAPEEAASTPPTPATAPVTGTAVAPAGSAESARRRRAAAPEELSPDAEPADTFIRRMHAWESDGVPVAIEVVDAATGRGVPAARIELESGGPGRRLSDDARSGTVVTDAAGRADIRAPAESMLSAETHADGHTPSFDAVRTPALGAGTATLRIALAPGGTLRGVVRDPKGAPVKDVIVDVLVPGTRGALESEPTGPDGAYRVDGLAFGTAYVARAFAPDKVVTRLPRDLDSRPEWCDSAPLPDVVTSPARRERVADFVLRSAADFDLYVTDETAKDGRAARFTVRLTGEYRGETWTDSSGHFWDALPPGRYTLHVSADDRVPVGRTLDVAEGVKLAPTISLSPGESISGVVTDEDGEPVRGCEVSAEEPPEGSGFSRPRTHTDAEGRFMLRCLARGMHELFVSPQWDQEEFTVPAVPAPGANVRLVVRNRGELTLRVTFEDDARAAPDARIAFHATVDGKPWEIDRLLPRDGRFAVAWPAAVRGDVDITVDGFIPVTRGVSVPTGAALDLGEVRLRRGWSVTGTFDGAAPGEIRAVGLWRGGTCSPDSSGRFTFQGLPPGPVLLRVPKLPGWSVRVDPLRREDLVISLPLPGELQIAVVDASGAPAANCNVVVTDAEGERLFDSATDVQGFAHYAIAPGRYVVDAGPGRRAEAEVRANDVTLVKLR